ncbi:MAG: LOG family protein [Vampirovibrionales bacterium]
MMMSASDFSSSPHSPLHKTVGMPLPFGVTLATCLSIQDREYPSKAFGVHTVQQCRLFSERLERDLGVIVYGGSRMLSQVEKEASFALGKGIASYYDVTLQHRGFVVTGGGGGHMQCVAEGAKSVGGTAIGVQHRGITKEAGYAQSYSEHYFVDTFAERLWGPLGFEELTARTAAVPGGIGTDMEILNKGLELHLNLTLKPAYQRIVLLDIDHYYTAEGGLMPHIDYIVEAGRIDASFKQLFAVCTTPEEALEALFEPGQSMTTGTHIHRPNPFEMLT